MAVAPPPPPSIISTSQIWSIIDRRVQDIIQAVLDLWGRPRSRMMTINIPLAGAVDIPVAGYLVSVGIANNIKIIGWEINALTQGSISLDIQVSTIQVNPSTVPVLTSLPGSSHYLTLTGYSTSNQDTSGWTTNQVSAGAILHIIVNSAATISRAVLVLRVIDMDSKTLQM